MEVNGAANIKILIDNAREDAQANNGVLTQEQLYKLFAQIDQQADWLVKYMRAYSKAVEDDTKTPLWHEVRDAN